MSHPRDGINGGNGGKWIRPRKRAAIYARDGHRCVYCTAPGESLDHVLPRPRGSNASHNLVTACLRCNSAKGDLSAVAFCATLPDPGAAFARVLDAIMAPLEGYRERMAA